MTEAAPPQRSAKSVAVVSGKGGSGKTMIATALAQGLGLQQKKVLLVDADFGTGGLTYYLGFTAFDRAREGLADYLNGMNNVPPAITGARRDAISSDRALANISLLPVGESRFAEGQFSSITKDAISELVRGVQGTFDAIIFDCRGGIDGDSLSVCEAVDEIVMIAETDAASIQSSQRLANVLYEAKLGRKLRGFILNKVMDDPTGLANVGKSLFRCEYIGSVPFDIDTTRRFIKGMMPAHQTLFCRHVFKAVPEIFPGTDELRLTQTLSAAEFGTISIKSPEIQLGNLALLLVGLLALFTSIYINDGRIWDDFWVKEFPGPVVAEAAFLVLFLLALSDRAKQLIGAGLRAYRNIIRRALSMGPRST